MKEKADFDIEARLSQQLLIGEILARNAFKFPDLEAFVLGGNRLSYNALDMRVNRLANALLAQGIAQGEKIGILMRNRQELLEIFFAAAKIGAVNVPINIRLSPSEIAYIVENSDTKILFMEEAFVPAIEKILDQLDHVEAIFLVGGSDHPACKSYDRFVADVGSDQPRIYVADEDEAFIIYTAGTTGKPKGALLTHKNMVCNALEVAHAMSLSQPRSLNLPPANPKSLVVAPLFHVAGIMNILRTMLQLTTVVLKDFDPVQILQTLESEQITYLFLVPAMWRILLDHPEFEKYDKRTLRSAGYGADIMPNSLKERILEAFPNASLFEAFGQTEMSATAIFMPHQDALRKEGSVGLPLRMASIRVVDDEMNDVATGQVGEIVYRGPTLFKGYYNHPEETDKAFEGGWFHSGDLVKQDEEGFVYIIDRKKDMILSGGENVYSAEVEEVLQECPKIKEAVIVGVPDPKWGQAVKAFVVLRENEEATRDEIMDFCRERLARYKCPKHIDFIDALPRSATGKVLKRLLRDTQ